MSETRKLAAIFVADIVGYSRLAGADDPDDRQLFIADAEQASLAAMPPESIGPGTAYRVVECVWRGHFKPADTGHEPQTALRSKRPKNDPRLKVITFEGVEYPSRVELAQQVAAPSPSE
jgi:hypothetical protein